jgi:hypothetical protein
VNRRVLQIQGNGGGKHFDMTDLLGRGLEQHVAILFRAAIAPTLKELLEANPHWKSKT